MSKESKGRNDMSDRFVRTTLFFKGDERSDFYVRNLMTILGGNELIAAIFAE